MLSMKLRQVLCMECSCCKQNMFEEPVMGSASHVEMMIFGVKKYAVCPLCLQEVGKENQTNGYKVKWHKKVLKIMEEREEKIKKVLEEVVQKFEKFSGYVTREAEPVSGSAQKELMEWQKDIKEVCKRAKQILYE